MGHIHVQVTGLTLTYIINRKMREQILFSKVNFYKNGAEKLVPLMLLIPLGRCLCWWTVSPEGITSPVASTPVLA